MEARKCTVMIDYPGDVISVNHYQYKNFHIKKEAKAWMDELGWLLKKHHLEDWKLPLRVECSGKFKNKRHQPDLSNLSKCSLDAIEEATGVNDRDMRWVDGEVSYGEPPTLLFEISEGG